MDLYQKLRGMYLNPHELLPCVPADPANPRPRAELGLVPAQKHFPGLWNKMFMTRKALGCDFREPDLGNAAFPSSPCVAPRNPKLYMWSLSTILLPSKARLWLFGFLSGFLWAWADGSIPCVPPPLALGLQHPVCDSDVGYGATSFISLAGFQGHCWERVWDFGLLGPSLAQLPRGLASGEALLIQELNTYLFSLFTI